MTLTASRAVAESPRRGRRRVGPTVVLPVWIGDLADRGVQGALFLAAGAAAGFAALGLGWAGVAARLAPPLQVPFLVSGALGGVALIGGCAGLLAVHLERRAMATDRFVLDQAVRAAGRLADVAPAVMARRLAARRVATPTSPLVHSRTTVHRPGCRMAAGRDLPAWAGGNPSSLKPCRICQPPVPPGAR